MLNSRNLKKRKKKQYLATTSTSQELVRRKLHDSILLEFELTDLQPVAGKQHLKYTNT